MRTPELIQYNLELHFRYELSASQTKEIMSIAESEHLRINLTSQFLTFECLGRDSKRLILKFCKRLAGIIRDAKGHLKCDITWTDDTESSEFYEIKNGELINTGARELQVA